MSWTGRMFAALMMMSCLGGTAAANEYFVHESGGPGDDRVRAVTEMDGRIFFGGVQDLSFPAATGLLIATETDGTVVFERAYQEPASSSVSIDALISDSGRLLAGGTLSTTSTTGTAFVMEVTPDGTIAWQRTLRGSDETSVAGLLATSDGGLLVLGSIFPAGEIFRDGWIAKLDPIGDIEWQKRMGTRGSDGFAAAVELPDGGFVIAGGVGSDRDPTGTLQGWLVALGADGELLWQRGYAANVGDSFSSVALTKQSILAFGSACGFCFFGPDGWIVETDFAGNLQDSIFLGDFEFPGSDSIVGVAKLTRGSGFVALGSTDTIAGPSQQLFAAHIDERAHVRWIRQIGEAGFDVAFGIAALPRGDFAFGGYTVSADDGHQALYGKLDKNGRSLDNCAAVSEAKTALRQSTMSTWIDATAAVSVPDVSSMPGSIVEVTDSPAPLTQVCTD